MKKVFISLVVLVLLLIDWMALRNIMKGKESTLSAEYVTLAGSIVIIIALLSYSLGKDKKKK